MERPEGGHHRELSLRPSGLQLNFVITYHPLNYLYVTDSTVTFYDFYTILRLYLTYQDVIYSL